MYYGACRVFVYSTPHRPRAREHINKIYLCFVKINWTLEIAIKKIHEIEMKLLKKASF